LAADMLTSFEAELDIAAPLVRVGFTMRALRQALERGGTESEKIIRTALVHKRKLRQGRDYRGQGTESDPFIFAEGLFYHEMFYKLCSQLDLDTGRRRLYDAPDGRWFDVVRGRDREYFFLIPKNVVLDE